MKLRSKWKVFLVNNNFSDGYNSKYHNYMVSVKERYLINWENSFISKWSWVGDENFTRYTQKLFLRTIFREGSAVLCESSKNELVVFRYWPMPFKSNPAIGINGVVNSVLIYPAWKNLQAWRSLKDLYHSNMIKNPIFKLRSQNTSIFYQSFQGEDYQQAQGLKISLIPHAQSLAYLNLSVQLASKLYGGKIVSSNNPRIKQQLDNNLYKLGSRLELDSNFNIENDKSIIDEITNKISVLNWKELDPTILQEVLDREEKRINKLFGFRANQQFKKERLIVGELENENADFLSSEKRQREALQDFTDEYNKKRNTNLILINNFVSNSNNKDNKITDGLNGEETNGK